MRFKKKFTGSEEAAAPSPESLPQEPPLESMVSESMVLESLPLRQRLSYARVGPAPAFGERFAGRTWLYVVWPPARSTPWPELPAANRYGLVGIGACLLWFVARLTIPPLYHAGAAAVFPYTAAGKSQTCLDNLRAIQGAVSLYAQDHDDRLPPLDTTASGQRVTWFSLVSPRATGKFQCPTGPAIAGSGEGLVSSYVLNPVLASHRISEADDPYQTLLLTDGGNKHDVSLLPPFPGWPSFAARPSGTAAAFDAGAANLGFRHRDGSQQLALTIYADGHAEPLPASMDVLHPGIWGGSMAVRGSLERFEQTNLYSRAFVSSLRQADVAGAARFYGFYRKTLKPVASGIIELWKLNDGEHASDSVQAIGWHLARAMEQAGDGSARLQLNGEMSRRVKAERDRAERANGQTYAAESGYAVMLPEGWTIEEKRVGRYLDTYIRSPLPEVHVLIETGDRSTYIEPRPLVWEGTERDLKRRYGPQGYRRIHIGRGSLYGNAASTWEYEIEKVGGPRLRKLCIGNANGWRSQAVIFTAPAQDFQSWRPLFQRAADSFHLQSTG